MSDLDGSQPANEKSGSSTSGSTSGEFVLTLSTLFAAKKLLKEHPYLWSRDFTSLLRFAQAKARNSKPGSEPKE